jgi:BirA family biotin operon repressor/biotin-[acetyl-CoA-carboxylase] ligase
MKQVKKKVLEYLARSGKVVSGEEMALTLGVTRAAVWKAVRELKQEGEDILSSRKGYWLRLKEEMRPSAFMMAVPQIGIVECYEEIASTNDRAKELALSGAPHFSLVTAMGQSQGRGRFSRTFYSQKGTGLYCSIILRPTSPATYIQRITACAAVAVCHAIEKLCPAKVGIKWVNDLWLGGKKICGILTEGALTPDGDLSYAIVGIGVNVQKTDFPLELTSIATDIETETGVKIPLFALMREILFALSNLLEDLERGDFLSEYAKRSVLTGKNVTLRRGDETLTGEVIRIGDMGELCLLVNGEEIAISSGEVVTLHTSHS